MNKQSQEIKETIQRTKRYWYVDGLGEIGAGIALCLVTLFYSALNRMEPSLLQMLLFATGLPALILLCNWTIGKAVRKTKEKITYPRTGYVAYPRKSGSKRWKRVILSALIGAGVGAMTSLLAGSLPVIYTHLFATLVTMLAYIYIGYSLGLPRFYLYAAACALLLAASTFFEPIQANFFLAFLGGQGMIWLLSGCITLLVYLRSTQPAQEDV